MVVISLPTLVLTNWYICGDGFRLYFVSFTAIYATSNTTTKRAPDHYSRVLFFHKQFDTFWYHNFSSQNYTSLISYDYAKDDVADIIKVLQEEDTMYIGGNPRMYLLASRLPELSSNGWILEYYLDFQWEEFYHEFKNKFPTYLFISHDLQSGTQNFVKNDYHTLIQSKHEKLWHVIVSAYEEHITVENGKWYKKISMPLN